MGFAAREGNFGPITLPLQQLEQASAQPPLLMAAVVLCSNGHNIHLDEVLYGLHACVSTSRANM
jgi:hypothetical protein